MDALDEHDDENRSADEQNEEQHRDAGSTAAACGRLGPLAPTLAANRRHGVRGSPELPTRDSP